jgi:hypothetical protein
MHAKERTSWTCAEQAVLFRTQIRPIRAPILAARRNCLVICDANCTATFHALIPGNLIGSLKEIDAKIAIAMGDDGFTI